MNNITGKIILKGDIKLLSPLLIANGESEKSDIEIIKDANNKPFIPATSFVGVLRSYLSEISKTNSNDFNYFFGYSDRQSSLNCRDLYPEAERNTVVIRDGIKTNNKTGLTFDKSKYDYEVLEPGAKFEMYIESFVTDKSKYFVTKIFNTIKQGLETSGISLGAKTNNGFGKISLENCEFYEYDFKDKKDVLKYLKNETGKVINSNDIFDVKKNSFEIDADFILKTSLIVRSYSSDPKKPDSVHITSNNESVLPGTSIKGAVRARAEKIAKTILNEKNAETLITELFGNVDPDKPNTEAVKGKISVEESILPEYPKELHSRIKIDRFTGGTIKGALFDTQPLWSDKDNHKLINIKLRIRDFYPKEAGLILLVLKDMWTGDMAFGGEKNIGRGVLEGVKAVIKYNGTGHIEISEKSDENSLIILTGFIEKLNEEGAANVK